jgi:uncharacterized protein with FMN-binding domain
MRGQVIPVRASVAIMSTIVSLVLLLGFKTPDTTRPSRPVAVLPSPDSQASPAAGAGSGSSPSSAPAAPSPSPSSGGLYKDGQYSGQDIQTQYGDNQVKVIISHGRITDVQALQLPFDRQRSQEISQVAGPMLHDEALQAQSAQIDTISGATYTSDAYAQSLQSALDRAHA